MAHYDALPLTEQEADRMSHSSDSDGEEVGQPHAVVGTVPDRHASASSPAGSHKSSHSQSDVLQKGDGFQQVPLEFENLGGSQHLEAAKEEQSSKLATLLRPAPMKGESVLTSVLQKLRKPSSENMYDLVEHDDYAIIDAPNEPMATPVVTAEGVNTAAVLPINLEAHSSDRAPSSAPNSEQHKAAQHSGEGAQLAGEPPNASQPANESSAEGANANPLPSSSTAMVRSQKPAPIAITIPPPIQSVINGAHEVGARQSTPTAPIVPVTPISAHSVVEIASPRPDLQSLQGAYVGNIARLERSVEHLSETSDIDSEIRRMREEMKERASSSGNGSVKKATSAISSPIAGSIVASPERTSAHSSPRAARAVHSRSHSGSHSATSRLPQTLDEIPEPEEDDRLLGNDIAVSHDINDAASFTRSAMPPPMTPSPPLHHAVDVQVTTPSTVHGDSRAKAADITDTIDLPRFEFGSYGYDNPESSYYPDAYMPTYPHQAADELQFARPQSAASGDTYQQARIAFQDFDGVHVGLHPRPSASIRRFSMGGDSLNLQLRPDETQPKIVIGADGQPQNVEGMIYYPAPVPRMLNMPQKLAKQKPDLAQQKRRHQLLTETFGGSQAYGEGGMKAANRRSEAIAKLPPALRAAAFFDGPMQAMDDFVLAPQGSAVQTMDAVLDAAAKAPTTGLTEGGVPMQQSTLLYDQSDSEGAKRKGGLFQRNKGKQKATSDDGDFSGDERPGTGDRMMPLHRQRTSDVDAAILAPGEDEKTSDAEFGEGQLDSDDDEFHGAPATLLAELELRKKAQKKRTQGKEIRSRMRSGVGGMGSTLLELDTIAQIQHEARRKQKKIVLAWEGPQEAAEEAASDNDDEVPLAVLMQKKKDNEERTVDGLHKLIEEFKPSGLMAQLDREENEPLIQRRARLRGEAYIPPNNRRSYLPSRAASMMGMEEEEEEDEIEGETLAQRAARLRRDETETLAQRAARLKKEKEEKEDADNNLTSDFAQDLLNLFDESKENAASDEKSVGRASHEGEESEKKEKRTARYRNTLTSGSMDNTQSRVVPRPQPQPSQDDTGEDETLAQRKARLLRESRAAPAAGNATDREAFTISVAKRQTTDPGALTQQDQQPLNSDGHLRMNSYMSAQPGQDAPGLARQGATWPSIPEDYVPPNQANANYPRAMSMTSYRRLGAHNQQAANSANVAHDRASTMVNTQNVMTSSQHATSRMTFQGMPLYAHYHAQQQQAAPTRGLGPVSRPLGDARTMSMAAIQRSQQPQPYRMSYLPAGPAQPNVMGAPAAANGTNPYLAPANPLAPAGAPEAPASYDSGFIQGYQAGLEQALKMTAMMGSLQQPVDGNTVQPLQPGVAYGA